jgi:alanyl-tRNA synthetase
MVLMLSDGLLNRPYRVGNLLSLLFCLSSSMQLTVNAPQRYAKMRAHTATHLLHAQLTQYFPNTKQAGSLVDSDLLRFDFYADTLLTAPQLKAIETVINQQIYEALPVSLIETSFDEAIKLGAKAFFEEKYGDVVRLIRVHRGDEVISAELCGGTHVENTREIGAFSILSQEAVASGIKRLTAITGPKVIEKAHTLEGILDEQVKAFDIKSYAQITEKTTKFLKEYEDMKAKLESLEYQLLSQLLQSTEKREHADFQIILELPVTTNFKLLPALIKATFPEKKSVLIYTSEGNYLILTDGTLSAKSLAQKYQWKGGGSDSIAQGKDEKVIYLL